MEFYIKNAAYNGIDFILFSNPKFLLDILTPYLGLISFIYIFKLLDLTLFPLFTSTGIIPSLLYIKKSIFTRKNL